MSSSPPPPPLLLFGHLYQPPQPPPAAEVAATATSKAAKDDTDGDPGALKTPAGGLPDYKDQMREATVVVMAALQQRRRQPPESPGPSEVQGALSSLSSSSLAATTGAEAAGLDYCKGQQEPSPPTVLPLAHASPVTDTQLSHEDRERLARQNLDLQAEVERQQHRQLQQEQEQQLQQKQKRRRIWTGVSMVLLVLAATATGVYCGANGNSCRVGSTAIPTTTRTTPPTTPEQEDGVRPKPNVDNIVTFINRITLSNRTLRYPANDTAEERALQWLIDEDVGTAPSNQLALRQRYVLASLRFGLTSTMVTTNATNAIDDSDVTSADSDSYAATWTNAALGECFWHGVECTKESGDGVVNQLELISSLVEGHIPDDLGLLTDLTELRLTGNHLTAFPWSFANLPPLAVRVTNGLTGTIPSTLRRLTALTSLSLSGNSFTGTIPSWFEWLTGLNSLHLSSNALTGTVPSSLRLLTALYSLELYDNTLTGTIPSSLAQLTSLFGLWLRGNALTGTIPSSLETLTGLNTLELSENALTGTIPSTLASLTALAFLGLSDNALNGTIPSMLESLTALFSLQLSGNALTGTIPSSLETLRNLGDLDLSDNALTGTIPSTLASLTLGWLLLNGNQLNDTASFCNDINASSQVNVILVADCDKVSCLCCNACCPTGRDGIPVYDYF